MLQNPVTNGASVLKDLLAGLVVFLVGLPLCLGLAAASNAPVASGLLTGAIAGILVAFLSGSQTSVSGPAVGITALLAAQIAVLGTFEAFLLAVVVAGLIQVGFGLVRAGFLAAFVPSSVIKGLVAAIGIILVLKQIPHLLGHDTDPEGEMRFIQPDHQNTFSEFLTLLNGEVHFGAMAIGLVSVVILLFWDNFKLLKNLPVPAPLFVVGVGVVLNLLFQQIGGRWFLSGSHLVLGQDASSLNDPLGFLRHPDFALWANPAIYSAGLTIAIAASLETLLNLEATDKIDPQQRRSPASRELVAQGVGNIVAGLLGGIPMTSMIVRSSVNIHAGGQTKLSAIANGVLIAVCVALLPTYLNLIPLSCLAAVLLVTGIKLASPKLFSQMWSDGRYQFIPFIATLVAIVMTDLLIGILIGLGISISFILASNFRRPLKRVIEKRLGGEVLHIELASQVSFLNRAVLERALREAPRGTHVLLDAHNTDYIDPDILGMIREFKEVAAPIQGVQLSLLGFRAKYHLDDEIRFIDHSTREIQGQMKPAQVLRILQEGNERFRKGTGLKRDYARQLQSTAQGQHPLAVILSCIDSRSPGELIFDLGLGDVFNVRIAGNVSSRKVLGSIEYGCACAGAKLILVMGHTRCGAVTASVDLACKSETAEHATGCQHLDPLVKEIQQSVDDEDCRRYLELAGNERLALVDAVARRNVERTVEQLVEQSDTISGLVRDRRVAVVGAMYDVATGQIDFFTDSAFGLTPAQVEVESETPA